MELIKNKQYYKFSAYGFLKNLRFFDAFFILFLIDSGMSFTQIGILYAVREIIINIFEIPSGIIADTYGRKSSLLASFLIYIISFVIFYLSADFWLFLLAFILYGIADAFRSGTHKGMIMDYLKINNWGDQKIMYYGHTRSWSQKGSAISSLIAGLLVFYSGQYQSIFLYSIAPYLLNLLLILSYPGELNHPIKQKVRQQQKFAHTFSFLLQSLKEKSVLKLINTSAVHSAYLKAVKDYIQPLMVHIIVLIPLMLNTDAEKKNGLFIGVFYFFIYLLTSRASQLSSKFLHKTKGNIPYFTLLIGFSLGILCGVFYVYELWAIALIFFVGIYMIENLRKPILTGYVADHVPSEILTSVMSVQSLLKTIITAILALVFGLLADKFSIGFSFISISLFLVLLSFALNIKWKHKR
ncbi:MAG: MFS transporter [Bacteroidales bacterium]|nr:MFS transporter [Bacteroidales bacterium]